MQRFSTQLGSRLVRSGALAILSGALLLGPAPSLEARGGAAQPPMARPDIGQQLFDQCIHWVSQGGRGIEQTSDFYINSIVELDLDTTTHRGPMRLWWQNPDKYRQELTVGRSVTTKILSGNQLWIEQPNGRTQRLHGTAGGVGAIRQLQEDRDRLGDLAQFITLRSLKGNGATFEFSGERKGNGTYAGDWVKLTRRAPGAATMHFWLAYDRASGGGYVAKWPGIVRIDGDPSRNVPTEDYLLRNWLSPRQGRTMRYPSVIEAYSLLPRRAPVRFLRAQVRDIKINAGIDTSRFAPRQARGGSRQPGR